MSRLIDADVLVKIIDKHTNDENQLDDDITCILEEVPTAYNVDKVVEALEEVKEERMEVAQHTLDLVPDGQVWGLRKAIEIVKGGGVNA